MARTSGPIVAFMQIILLVVTIQNARCAYLGKSLGRLTELHHGLSGEVFAIDARTLHLKDFTYDGQGAAAYFYAANTRTPSASGFRIRDENGSTEMLRRYRKESVTLTLPEGKTLNNIKTFYVWCEDYAVSFGDVKIPRNFDYPRPRKIDALKGVHSISSDNIVVVDAQTLLIPNLSYDGEAPDAKFWVGKGSKPSPQGVRVPDENGKEVPLRRYDQKTVVLTLPGDVTIFDIDYFGIWCEAFTVDFGHILIPKDLNVPPSLKMLGISPQSKLNCEVLHDDLAFEVRWAIAGDSIVLQLVAKLENGEYMAFGISGDNSKTVMVGGDVAVAWIDKETLKGRAEDYYLADKSQCSGPTGSCPDERLESNTNSVRILNAAVVNGYSIVTYQRPIKASDKFDRDIFTNESQAIIWAIGPLNQRDEVSFHSHWTKKDVLFNFGRQPKWNCPMPETEPSAKVSNYQQTTKESAFEERIPPSTTSSTRNQQRRRGEVSNDAESENKTPRTHQRGQNQRPVPTPAPVVKREAWKIPPIQCYEPEDGVYYAQMGPTGGKRGYPAITGHVGWGISWYINGLLIPEINLVRGKTYTFVVEGGLDPEVAAKYHPFYITDDPVGGYEYKTAEERAKVKIYAGAKQRADGTVVPLGVGRLCHWTHQGDLDADDYESFGAYQRTLELKCDHGEPGVIQFTPDKNTPDTLYYQCFTHRYLGWKINVLDSCDSEASASEVQPLTTPSKNSNMKQTHEDLDDSPSIRVETRIKAPNRVIDEYTKNTSTKLAELFAEPILNLPLPVVAPDTLTIKNDSTRATSSVEEQLTTYSINISDITEKIAREPESIPLISPKLPFEAINSQLKVMIPRPFLPSSNIRIYKKPFYGPLYSNKPLLNKHYPSMPLQFQIPHKKPLTLMLVKNVPNSALLVNPHPQVEISPHQLSTEKETQSTTEVSYSSSLPPVTKKQYESYQSATDTGFNPESIVIEGGFRPIISKEIQDRSEDGPELKYESEVGIIDVSKQNTSPHVQTNKMLGKINRHKNNGVMFIIKRTREDRKDSLFEDDEVAEAAERVDTFYLPPPNKIEKPKYNVMKPSNIDVAPGTVVTYDGKKLSGASLTVRIADRGSTALDSRTSKATELIKSSPQFRPFRGDLPPLQQTFIDTSAPQLHQRGIINRHLESPSNAYLPLPPDPHQGSTKLVLVRQLDDAVQGDEPSILLPRNKREAHHTPEHTAEQNSRNNKAQMQKPSIASTHLSSLALIFGLGYILRCF